MDNCIVYIGHCDDVCVYVGEGKAGRESHLNSGISHVYEANQQHFKGKKIRVEIKHRGVSKQEALVLEKNYIETLKPLWNRDMSTTRFSKVEVNRILRKCFGRKLKTKTTQVEVARYILSILDKDRGVKIHQGQVEAITGHKSILSHAAREFGYEEIRSLFNIVKQGSGYQVTLLEDWLNEV